MKALILTADGFEDLELFAPWYRLREEGVEVTLAGPGPQVLTGLHGYRVEPDMPIRELNPASLFDMTKYVFEYEGAKPFHAQLARFNSTIREGSL